MDWKEYVKSIYGEEAGEWIPKLEKRIESSRLKMTNERQEENCQNIILITYPDQIRNGNSALQTFEEFAKDYLYGVFDVIHFLPFCPYSSDDGFSVIDYRVIDGSLGSWHDLKKLAEHFTLMYDFVCNHISSKSEWFIKCLAGDNQYKEYFIKGNPAWDLSKVVRPRTTPLLTKFETKEGEKYYWSTFSDDQIDLNYGNPQVLYEIVDIFLSYVENGGKWIRLDAIGYLWKEIGTTCIHHKKTHEFVKLLRSIMDVVYPSGKIITETNVPQEDNIAYFGNGMDESHMVYQFPLPMLVLYSFYRQNAEIITSWAQRLCLPSDKVCFFNFLASHDGIGVNPVRNIIPEGEIDSLIENLQNNCGALISYKDNEDGSKSAYEVNVSYFSAIKENYDMETAIQRFITAHQSVGDTVGPGGIFRAMRTVPMYEIIANGIKEYCPEAWVINYTNPMSICTGALYKIFPKIKAFGCCHEVFGVQRVLLMALKEELGIEEQDRHKLCTNVAGINHFTWITEASYKEIDLFPIYKKYVEKHFEKGICDKKTDYHFSSMNRVKFDLFQKYGVIAAAGDRHLAEFVPDYIQNPETVASWGYSLTPVDYRIENKKDLDNKSKAYVSGELEIPIEPSGEEGVAQIKALLGLGDLITNVNLPNKGQMDAPHSVVVETNALFTRNSVRPLLAGQVSDGVKLLLGRHMQNQEMILKASLERDKKLAYQAFCNDPMTARLTRKQAKELFDQMFQNTKEYLPEYVER